MAECCNLFGYVEITNQSNNEQHQSGTSSGDGRFHLQKKILSGVNLRETMVGTPRRHVDGHVRDDEHFPHVPNRDASETDSVSAQSLEPRASPNRVRDVHRDARRQDLFVHREHTHQSEMGRPFSDPQSMRRLRARSRTNSFIPAGQVRCTRRVVSELKHNATLLC